MKKLEERKWRVVSSEYLARKPWFTVRHECVELPNGNRIPDYYVFEYPDWINVIAITRDHQFVFVSQYRHGLGSSDYELVAGCCDATDSTPLDAARRELWEESGYGGGTWSETMQICANPATQNNMTHCFLAVDVEPVSTQHLEPTEDLRVHLFTRDEVRSLLDTNAIKQALMVAPLWQYFAQN